MSTEEILNLKMGANDADAETVREYLVELLLHLWHEGEGFSGKRPFGNSGWDHELFCALITGKAMAGVLDEDGYIAPGQSLSLWL